MESRLSLSAFTSSEIGPLLINSSASLTGASASSGRPLTRFAETERHELKPLPDRAFEPAQWKRLLLHRDSHVRFEKSFYSAPFMHIDERLWVRATATMVQIFAGHEMVASHPRCRRPGESSTVTDHLPPEAQAFLRMTPAWCREQAEEIGPCCRAGDRRAPRRSRPRASAGRPGRDRPVQVLRSRAPGVRLPAGSGLRRCPIPNDQDDPASGLDQVALQEEAFDRLADVYTGSGRFTRDVRHMLMH